MSTAPKKEERVTFVKVQTGIFEVYLDGEKTAYQVINGSLGTTGRDTPNTYGVTKGGELVRWLGPLRTAKALATGILTN